MRSSSLLSPSGSATGESGFFSTATLSSGLPAKRDAMALLCSSCIFRNAFAKPRSASTSWIDWQANRQCDRHWLPVDSFSSCSCSRTALTRQTRARSPPKISCNDERSVGSQRIAIMNFLANSTCCRSSISAFAHRTVPVAHRRLSNAAFIFTTLSMNSGASYTAMALCPLRTLCASVSFWQYPLPNLHFWADDFPSSACASVAISTPRSMAEMLRCCPAFNV